MMTFFSISTGLLAVLLILFSAVQIGISAYVLHYNTTHSASNHQSFQFLNNNNLTFQLYWLPLVNATRSYILQVATGALGIIIGAAVIILSLRAKPLSLVITGKSGARRIGWSALSATLVLLFFSLSLSTLVVTFYDLSHYGPSSITSFSVCLGEHISSGTRNCGTNARLFVPITIEGWTCRLSNTFFGGSLQRSVTDHADELVPRACRISKVAKWWTIPLLIVPILIILVALFETRRKNIARFNSVREPGLHPKESSFSSAETANANNPPNNNIDSPVSPIGTLPRYTVGGELDGKTEAATEAGSKQIMEVPAKSHYDEMPAQTHQLYSELSANRSKNDVKAA